MHTIILGLCGLVSAAALTGCRNRAYNDLYVENMASEIRDLENQLYEYDHEYRLLEQELETLRQQNAALKTDSTQNGPKRSLLSPRPKDGSTQHTPAPLEFQPRSQSLPITPEPALRTDELQPEPESILEGGNASGRALSEEEIPAPKSGSVPPSGASVAPERLRTQPPSASPPGLRNPNSPPADSTPSLPKFPAPADGNEFNSEELLLPPTIDPGIPAPPPLPVVTQLQDGTTVAPENNLEMNLSRIEIPNQKTTAQLASNSEIKQATIQIATEKVTDTRVIELAFHPTLSRAIDMDDRPDDDGLYLVLQPKNERGQMVPVAADLTIFALDPARQGDAAKIGRWEYSAADVEAKMQPIGNEQGIHFRLPWNGPDPSADRVIVFALFKFENGRQVMGEKEIFVSSDGSHKIVWTARGNSLTSTSIPEVAQAGYTAPTSKPLTSDAPTSNPPGSSVVRPASGTSTFDPAPRPRH